MENKQEFQDMLRERLHLLFPDAKDASSRREVRINCPMCERDGFPDRGHHLYISLGYGDKPPMYNCFKNMNHRGVLTNRFLETFSINPQYMDASFEDYLQYENKRRSNLSKYRLIRSGKINLIPFNSINKNNETKLQYINKRLGLNLSIDDCTRDKIIFSLYDLLNYNHIRNYTRAPDVMNYLNNFYLGFISNNNSRVQLRNLVKKKGVLPSVLEEKRYINYLVGNQRLENTHYIIPSTCDIYQHIDIHFAEGPFDILSVFYNLRGANRINNVYIAIGGNSYLSVIKYFLIDLGLIDITFHIYIDNDIDNRVLKKVKEKLFPLGIEVYVHMNTKEGQKDFGVPKDEIKEYIYKLV